MRDVTRFLLATCIFALATWAAPWPVIPVVSAVMLLVAPRAFSPLMLACAAGTAWGGILAWTTLYAPLGRLAAELGGIVHLPGAALVALSLAVAFGLAWGGAEVAVAVHARARPSVNVPEEN
jgi:hypothetical protein